MPFSLPLSLITIVAGGDKFHLAFLQFFRLYVRLFLNSFGIQSPRSPVCFLPFLALFWLSQLACSMRLLVQ